MSTKIPWHIRQEQKLCNCYKCRAERGLPPLKVTTARPARRNKDGHFAGCKYRHPGWCHCRNVITEQMMMEQ